MSIIANLLKDSLCIANDLDNIGMYKEAGILDNISNKILNIGKSNISDEELGLRMMGDPGDYFDEEAAKNMDDEGIENEIDKMLREWVWWSRGDGYKNGSPTAGLTMWLLNHSNPYSLIEKYNIEENLGEEINIKDWDEYHDQRESLKIGVTREDLDFYGLGWRDVGRKTPGYYVERNGEWAEEEIYHPIQGIAVVLYNYAGDIRQKRFDQEEADKLDISLDEYYNREESRRIKEEAEYIRNMEPEDLPPVGQSGSAWPSEWDYTSGAWNEGVQSGWSDYYDVKRNIPHPNEFLEEPVVDGNVSVDVDSDIDFESENININQE